MSDDSIRQRIISNVVATLRGSGLVLEAEDGEPADYTEGKFPRAWVIEGDEDATTNGAPVGKYVCNLSVVVQIAFAFDSRNSNEKLFPKGRALLASVQALMVEDIKRGGSAFLTIEAGNSIGKVDGTEKSIGVLTTFWAVRYFRSIFNPAAA